MLGCLVGPRLRVPAAVTSFTRSPMRDPSDPPPKVYGFKPKAFDRVNAPPSAPSPAPCPPSPVSCPPPPDPDQPITVADLHRAAAVPGPVLRSEVAGGLRSAVEPPASATHDIPALLRDNLARETAAGLHGAPASVRRRPRRRLRDYLFLLILGDSLLGFFAVYGFRTGNAVQFISAVAGLGLYTAALTWVMWFVMDDY